MTAAALAAAGLVLVGPFDAALLKDLNDGLAALPVQLRAFPGGPLELELHPTPAPFGMGGWSDGHRRFHLHAFENPTGERRATWRTDGLPPAERESLWRRRAIVHAVMQRWEDAHHFSRAKPWRALSGWVLPFERPLTWSESALNRAEAGYSRSLGHQSAELDFVTFAEEHFVPVPGIAADDQIRCQEFSKRRVLEAALSDAGLAEKTDRGVCPAFDAWADLATLDRLEVLLVQASGRAVQSLFGHVLLRPVHHETDRVRGPSFDTAIQLAALTNPELGVRHLATGVFGGYRMTVFTLSWRDFEREMLEDEQRSIRRFALQLTPAQARQVLERAWELERRGEYQYQFFSDNCAAGLQWLLVGALGTELEVPNAGRFIVAPGSVVDGLAEATMNGRRLLARLPDDFDSTSQRAERSETLRLAVEARLLDQVPQAVALFAQARSNRPADRVAAYEAIAALARKHPLPSFYDWWALTVRIERPNADRAEEVLRMQSRRTAIPTGKPFDPDDELRLRQQSFEKESWLQRQVMMVDRAQAIQQRLDETPHRALAGWEEVERADARAALDAFDQVTQLHGAVVAELFPNVDPGAWLENDRRHKAGVQAEVERNAVPQSGHWRTAVGAGAAMGRAGAVQPVIAITSSGLAELLGDQRIRGFQASSEIRILDTEVVLAPQLAWGASEARCEPQANAAAKQCFAGGLSEQLKWPEVVQSRFTLFAFRSIKRELPMMTDSPLRPFGWGVALDTDYRAGRTLPSRTTVSGELIGIGPHSRTFGAFVTGALGANVFLGWGEDLRIAPGVSPYAEVRARLPLPGHGANALRVEARGLLGVTPTRAQLLIPELTVSAGVDVLLGSLLVKPQLWVQAEPGSRPVQLLGVVAFEVL